MEGQGRSVESFIGESPAMTDSDEKADLMRAIERAAEAAGTAGHGGQSFDISVEVDVAEHNQWVKTMRVIITPHGEGSS